MLSLPSKPAVVMMQTMVDGAAVDPKQDANLWKPFHVTQEDVYGALAQYYDLQVLINAPKEQLFFKFRL